MKAQIEFHGQLGFYQLSGNNPKARRWLAANVSFEPWQGTPADGIAVEGNDRCQWIADGAHEAGLVVFINGRRYLGEGRLAAA